MIFKKLLMKPGELYPISYDIKDELKIRKILENNNSFEYEFRKNDDKYGYDIEVYEYILINNEWNRKLLGYIEVERALKWIEENSFPENWYRISLLKRKLFKFDRSKNIFTNEPKYNEITFYLKFNTNYTNCFCERMDKLIEKGKDSNRRTNELDLYYGSYWEVEKTEVIVGIKNCIDYITKEIYN